ncbi:MAG: hypothetical protein SCALA702_00010 [Melioribacteraceae bacterium]|nr:MAG: hypothetical protein SCALA702_00010 [Melioribacteraceae bacterium]
MEKLIHELSAQKFNAVFNPWFDFDPEHDIDHEAPIIRLNNLKFYLEERMNARNLLVGEAMGYNGGHFSGIPMTSERILLGHKEDEGINRWLVSQQKLKRTSKKSLNELGYTEITATVVWRTFSDENLDTRDFIFWNAFPLHPYNDKILSNRPPNFNEIQFGKKIIEVLLKSFPSICNVIAMGYEAAWMLCDMKIQRERVRHPANGGAADFVSQIKQIISA